MYDVAIVGYGPTGATLANLLAANGRSVLILERETTLYDLPRAVHFDDEVMRVFQTIGIADALLPMIHLNPGMKFVGDDDALLLDWPRPPEVTDHGWNASYRFHQPDLEALLRRKLEDAPGAKIITGFDVTEVSESAEAVTLSGMNRATHKPDSFTARFVVGCDGANSLIRRSIGSGMDDLGFDERWLVIDMLLKCPRPDLGDHTIQFCNPARPITYCRGPGIRRRWEITIRDGERDEDIMDPARAWDILSRWITPQEATLERRAVYTFRSRIAQKWRRGRLLIAGDAAHLMPPFMGQGMCAGIRDAANLAWKLVAATQGQCDSLLNTYQAERAPHARAYVETAVRLGGLINALDRESALALADPEEGGSRMRSITPKLGRSSILNPDSGETGGAEVGRPLAQLNLDKGRFDDLIGYRHAIISYDEVPAMKDTVWLNAATSPVLAEILRACNAGAIWVRPDRYIGAIAPTVEGLRLPDFPGGV